MVLTVCRTPSSELVSTSYWQFRRERAPDVDTCVHRRCCSERRTPRRASVSRSCSSGAPCRSLVGAPAALADCGRADRRRRPSNRSRRYKRVAQLFREPANVNPRRAARQEGQVGAPPSPFARPGRRGGGGEAELRRAALRGSLSSERAKGGERRMMGQSLLLGQAARPWGERTQLLCLPRCWDK